MEGQTEGNEGEDSFRAAGRQNVGSSETGGEEGAGAAPPREGLWLRRALGGVLEMGRDDGGDDYREMARRKAGMWSVVSSLLVAIVATAIARSRIVYLKNEVDMLSTELSIVADSESEAEALRLKARNSRVAFAPPEGTQLERLDYWVNYTEIAIAGEKIIGYEGSEVTLEGGVSLLLPYVPGARDSAWIDNLFSSGGSRALKRRNVQMSTWDLSSPNAAWEMKFILSGANAKQVKMQQIGTSGTWYSSPHTKTVQAGGERDYCLWVDAARARTPGFKLQVIHPENCSHDVCDTQAIWLGDDRFSFTRTGDCTVINGVYIKRPEQTCVFESHKSSANYCEE